MISEKLVLKILGPWLQMICCNGKPKTSLVCILALSFVNTGYAAVLPEDRADLLYHSYDGGGVTISGPSLLVLKQLGGSAAITGNYYIDNVTSASIDVVTTASKYTEKRTEQTIGFDYIHNKSSMSLAYTTSEENDFSAESAHLNYSQDFFGDLTTLSMGYSRGWDEVGQRGDDQFSENADRHHYKLGISQVITKNSILDLGFETITDEGFLNNPYRSVRYQSSSAANGLGYEYEPEVYPNTRTSNAFALRTLYYLPYRAAIRGEYRYFQDDWNIVAHTAEVGYTHPAKGGWTYEVKLRFYTQTNAEFYSDLFPFSAAQNFRARDKELSSFNSQTLGVAASYNFLKNGWKFVDRGTVNLSVDHIQFDYDNFRDASVGLPAGQEPLYSFSANVIQFFVSLWY